MHKGKSDEKCMVADIAAKAVTLGTLPISFRYHTKRFIALVKALIELDQRHTGSMETYTVLYPPVVRETIM